MPVSTIDLNDDGCHDSKQIKRTNSLENNKTDEYIEMK